MITLALALTLAVGANDIPALPPSSWRAEVAVAPQILPAGPPLCHVQAYARPVAWNSDLSGLPWRYLVVQTTPDCPAGGEARVRLTHYGGRYPGAPVVIQQGLTTTFGPVPLARGLEWLSPTNVPYAVRISPGEP